MVVDIPTELLDGERSVMYECVRDALESGLDSYFDTSGNFSGIYINFDQPVFPADGKKRLNDCERLTFNVDDKTYDLLNRAKCYTSMSIKNFAEVVILKELLLAKKRGEDCAKDGTVHNEQSDEADS